MSKGGRLAWCLARITPQQNGAAQDPEGRNTSMSNLPPDDDLLIRAMASYLDESLSAEEALREILATAGFNDPKLRVEECVQALVDAYLRQNTPS